MQFNIHLEFLAQLWDTLWDNLKYYGTTSVHRRSPLVVDVWCVLFWDHACWLDQKQNTPNIYQERMKDGVDMCQNFKHGLGQALGQQKTRLLNSIPGQRPLSC